MPCSPEACAHNCPAVLWSQEPRCWARAPGPALCHGRRRPTRRRHACRWRKGEAADPAQPSAGKHTAAFLKLVMVHPRGKPTFCYILKLRLFCKHTFVFFLFQTKPFNWKNYVYRENFTNHNDEFLPSKCIYVTTIQVKARTLSAPNSAHHKSPLKSLSVKSPPEGPTILTSITIE